MNRISHTDRTPRPGSWHAIKSAAEITDSTFHGHSLLRRHYGPNTPDGKYTAGAERVYSTLADLIEHVDNFDSDTVRTDRYGHLGGFAHNCDLLKNGSPDDRKQAKQLRAQLAPIRATLMRQSQNRTTRTLAVAGNTVNVGRYLTGRPDCMYRTVRGAAAPLVRICVNISAPNGTGRIFARRGAAVTALVETILAAQYAVQIDITDPVSLSGCYYTWTATVKRFDETIELDRLAYMLANIGIDHSINFHVLDSEEPALLHHIGQHATGRRGRYGVPVEYHNKDAYEIYIPCIDKYHEKQYYADDAAILNWIEMQLHGLGIITRR